MAHHRGPMRELSVFGVWGRSGSGKTRLVEQLIAHLVALGLRVGSVKHTHHDAEVDRPGKDSHRHAMAGARRVLLLGPMGAALFVHDGADAELAAWLPQFAGHVDILLVEGFKRTPMPHVELIVEERSDIALSRAADEDSVPAWLIRRPDTGEDPLHYPADLVARLAEAVLQVSGHA